MPRNVCAESIAAIVLGKKTHVRFQTAQPVGQRIDRSRHRRRQRHGPRHRARCSPPRAPMSRVTDCRGRRAKRSPPTSPPAADRRRPGRSTSPSAAAIDDGRRRCRRAFRRARHRRQQRRHLGFAAIDADELRGRLGPRIGGHADRPPAHHPRRAALSAQIQMLRASSTSPRPRRSAPPPGTARMRRPRPA